MRLLVTGICGFVGSTLAGALLDDPMFPNLTVTGIDNLSRPGSALNLPLLRKRGIRVLHGDVRQASDLDILEAHDWVLDAAANPSVLAGIDGRSSSRQLVEHNLVGTINVLEYCKRVGAGFLLLSTSRVYAMEPLSGLQLAVQGRRFVPVANQAWPAGVGLEGVTEHAPTDPPISLYGASKLASEVLALEYSAAFNLPVWIDRCGVLAGAGQFGRADQGLLAFWLNAWRRDRPLTYIGFGGHGYQVRDCLHPRDLAGVLQRQMNTADRQIPRICNFSGGAGQSVSLAELSDWCRDRFGPREVQREETPRQWDVPWLVLDHGRAQAIWGWRPRTPVNAILAEIADHAELHPDWLDLSSP